MLLQAYTYEKNSHSRQKRNDLPGDFMFRVGKHTFTNAEHTFTVAKHTFPNAKHKLQAWVYNSFSTM